MLCEEEGNVCCELLQVSNSEKFYYQQQEPSFSIFTLSVYLHKQFHFRLKGII